MFLQFFRVLPNFHECFYLTNRFHVAVRTDDVKMWREQKSGTRGKAQCVTDVLPHFDIFFDLLLNRRTATWNLLVLYNNEKPFLFHNISTQRESRPLPRPPLPTLAKMKKKPFDVIYYLYKMKQFHWLPMRSKEL